MRITRRNYTTSGVRDCSCVSPGEMIQPVGCVTVHVYHQKKSYQLPCLVVQGTCPSLLGKGWLEHLKLDMDSVDYAQMFPELFSEGLGTLKGVEATLHVDDKMVPRCFKPRPVPLALRGKVETELDRLQTQGVIKPVGHSDWAAPIVPVLKANGEIYIYGDYKLSVNVASKVDKYPIPNIGDLYSKLLCALLQIGLGSCILADSSQ